MSDRARGDAEDPDRPPPVRLRAANRTILLVAGVATVVQSAGAVGKSLAQVAVAGVGVALAVFAVWLQLPKRAWKPSLVFRLAATLWLAVACYAVVLLAGVVTAGSDGYEYGSGVRPEDRTTVSGDRGSLTRTTEWTLAPGARADTVFRRTRRTTRDPTSLTGGISLSAPCGRVDWTLSADDRPLARGTVDAAAGPQPLDLALPGGFRAEAVRLTLARADGETCTATVSASPLKAVGRPSIPLPGLSRFLQDGGR